MSRGRRGGPVGLRVAPVPVVRHCLPNGLKVVLCPTPHLGHAYVSAFFGVGSRHETPGNNGITHVLEHMLFRGTASYRDATVLNCAAEELGGFLEGATYRDHLFFATGCHPSATARAIDILGEVVGAPRYQGFEVERSILREELLETIDGQGRMIDLDNIAHRAVFGNHGLGLPIEGTLQNLEAMTLRQLETHRRQHLVGRRGVVSVAGPIDPARVLKRVEAAFGGLSSGTPREDAAPPGPRAEPVLRFVRDAGSQVDLRITFWAVPIADPDYPALVMLGRLLGDGLASRMNAELVDRQGLAYSLHAGITRYADCGLFDFELSVAPDRAAAAVQAILSFVAAAPRFRFTEEEMQRVRRRYRYAAEFRGDSAADLATWHGTSALFEIEDQVRVMGARMNKVTAADVRRAARRVFTPRGMVLTAAGELVRGEWKRVRDVVDPWGHR